MKRILIYILSAVTVISGCKQESFPESIVTEPAFKVEMSVNGENMSLTPGVNGYYMHTGFTGFAGNGARMESGIAPAICPECGPALWIEFQSAFGQFFVPENELVPGQFAYFGAEHSELFALNVLNFSQFQQGMGAGILVNNEPMNSPTTLAAVTEIGLEIQYQYSGIPGLNGFASLNITEDGLECLGPVIMESISIEVIEPGVVQLNHPGGYAADHEILWVVNSNEPYITSFGVPVELSFNPAEGLFIQALLLGEDQEPVWISNLGLPEPNVGSYAPLRFVLNPIGINDESRLSLRYVDQFGNQYRTENCSSGSEQGATSSFNVLEASDFGQNEFGAQTRKLKFNAIATLFPVDNPDLEPLSLQISNAEFAFAIE